MWRTINTELHKYMKYKGKLKVNEKLFLIIYTVLDYNGR